MVMKVANYEEFLDKLNGKYKNIAFVMDFVKQFDQNSHKLVDVARFWVKNTSLDWMNPDEAEVYSKNMAEASGIMRILNEMHIVLSV